MVLNNTEVHRGFGHPFSFMHDDSEINDKLLEDTSLTLFSTKRSSGIDKMVMSTFIR